LLTVKAEGKKCRAMGDKDSGSLLGCFASLLSIFASFILMFGCFVGFDRVVQERSA